MTDRSNFILATSSHVYLERAYLDNALCHKTNLMNSRADVVESRLHYTLYYGFTSEASTWIMIRDQNNIIIDITISHKDVTSSNIICLCLFTSFQVKYSVNY